MPRGAEPEGRIDLLTRLARVSPRVKRVYFYNWTPGPTWDSGLMDRRGRPRPAYQVIRSWLSRSAR